MSNTKTFTDLILEVCGVGGEIKFSSGRSPEAIVMSASLGCLKIQAEENLEALGVSTDSWVWHHALTTLISSYEEAFEVAQND